MILEVIVILAILYIIFISVGHDIECQWVDIKTGERYTITSAKSGWNVVGPYRTSPLHMLWWPNQLTMDVTMSYPLMNMLNSPLGYVTTTYTGVYDRSGTITWSNKMVWKRVTATVKDWNWVRWYNVLSAWTIDGSWIADGGYDVISIAIDTTDTGLTAKLRNGSHVDILKGTVTSNGAQFTNELGETFDFIWDEHRATMWINGQTVTMDRISD